MIFEQVVTGVKVIGSDVSPSTLDARTRFQIGKVRNH